MAIGLAMHHLMMIRMIRTVAAFGPSGRHISVCAHFRRWFAVLYGRLSKASKVLMRGEQEANKRWTRGERARRTYWHLPKESLVRLPVWGSTFYYSIWSQRSGRKKLHNDASRAEQNSERPGTAFAGASKWKAIQTIDRLSKQIFFFKVKFRF